MPHNYGYSNRDSGGGGGSDDDDDDDGVKPYTAVGAALDSASRFKRRMNYGRTPTKTWRTKQIYIAILYLVILGRPP